MMGIKHCLTILFLAFYLLAKAQTIVLQKQEAAAFPLVASAQTASILYDAADDPLIGIAAQLLASDVEKVTGKKPFVSSSLLPAKNVVIIGSIGKSGLVQQLIKEKKLNVSRVRSKWEGYQICLVRSPFKGIEQALVIIGSDRRGTAYGVTELSKQIGVSPWWWWADVPVKDKKEIYIKAEAFLTGAPSVKYRGIFINDEAPAFSGWAKEKFGGINHLVYEKVFELLLRLKANYLWPAMWGNAFNDDDTLNPILADKWGIVMGTSHHEPMLRAQQEWKRYGKGAWDYTKNDSVLKAFWRKGMENMKGHESIVTIGMRGDGDEPMTQGTATALLERIVKDQRKILEDVTGKPASQTPQLWALYKEVQDYYDKGMRVPDDVTLLLCDDNWGNIRKLPNLNEPKRSGGYGIYYHFDYVGGPRNYKWVNTNNLARVWEQMHLAKEYGVDKVWIVNVGDIKPMELPISFFLDYAWNTKAWNEDNLREYYTKWATEQFGATHAKEIGEVLRKYAQYAARRKPELLDEKTYPLSVFARDDEWGRVLNDWSKLQKETYRLLNLLPTGYKDAFYELVLHPVNALTNLHYLYAALASNKVYAAKNSALANRYADAVKYHYKEDSILTAEYHTIAGGKWNHIMDQTHIGYTYWQQPPVNKMPEVTYVTQPIEDGPQNEISSYSAEDSIPTDAKGPVFFEWDGIASMQAENWTKAINTPMIKWKVIPDIGKDGSGITTFPVTASTKLSAASPHVEYDFYTYDSGTVNLNLYFSPSLNFHNRSTGLQYAVSIDDEKPQIFSLNKEDNNVKVWESWVANNIIQKKSAHKILKPGKHRLSYWAMSPAVVLQKLVLNFGDMQSSYLGPLETKHKTIH